MNTIKISAALTAALLTGALSATAFAAETLTTTTGSITFRKAIDVTNAAGAGGITGTIAFDVTAADESDLPADGEKNYVGSVDQLDGSDIIATFAADDSGIANKESDVSVGFDTSKFEAPGVYYYHLTERDPGIHGLTATTATYLLKVRVVNDNTSDPDGATFKIDYATLTSLDDNTKSDLITNTYTTHGLTVTKALAGDWADYTDHFIFTLEITDPDADPSRMASVTVQTTSAAGVTSGAEVKPFTNGKVSFSETIRGGDVIEVTGLPTGAAYTITESGLDAEKYTTAWTLDGETLSTERALPTQTVGAADTALTVTNTRSSIAPTGLLLDAAPYGAMLALAAGSGAVFFSGCNLRCVFCQNHEIAAGKRGQKIDESHLAEIFLKLQQQKANNINLVTPTQYVLPIIAAVKKAKAQGLKIPVVYNTSGYERVETLKNLEGIVDVYLPDFKYTDTTYAKRYSNAPDYFDVTKAALAEMVRQHPTPQFADKQARNGRRNHDRRRDCAAPDAAGAVKGYKSSNTVFI